jgi:hypothetical protein
MATSQPSHHPHPALAAEGAASQERWPASKSQRSSPQGEEATRGGVKCGEQDWLRVEGSDMFIAYELKSDKQHASGASRRQIDWQMRGVCQGSTKDITTGYDGTLITDEIRRARKPALSTRVRRLIAGYLCGRLACSWPSERERRWSLAEMASNLRPTTLLLASP